MWQKRKQTVAPAACVAAILLAGVLAYGYCLRLPFFSDDTAHYRWMQGRSLADIWGLSRQMGYYRPLPFTLWYLLFQLQGRYDAPTLHALNLALHLLNATLLFALVQRQGGKRGLMAGLAAGLLFLLFPFSYQAVSWIASLTHLLVTALILASLLLFTLPGRLARAASIALALAAPFAHETGVLAAPLLLLMLLTDDPAPPLRQALRQTLPYWACTALGLAAWLLAPKGELQVGLPELSAVGQNAAMFLQGLAYPVSPLAGRLLALAPGLRPVQAVAWVSTVSTAILVAVLLRLRQKRPLLLALGWFTLMAAPACLTLPFAYIEDGPRLHYEASVAAALLWSIPMRVSWRGRFRYLGLILAGLIVLGAALGGYRFIRGRVPLYRQMERASEQALALRPAAPSERILCVNYPLWFALAQSTYAVGREGTVFIYSSLSDLLWLHTGQEWNTRHVVLFDLLPPCERRYLFACLGDGVLGDDLQTDLRWAQHVLVTLYDETQVTVRDAGGLEAEGQPEPTEALASFDEQITLLGAQWERQGQEVALTLRWQCRRTPAQDVTVFVHLYDEAGALVAQADGYPLLGMSRLLSWQPGDVWRDGRVLVLPPNLAAGRYTLKAGLYPTGGGPRLSATGAAGRFADDAVPIGTLSLP